jgi:RimJ/RimL family protein N-acetyltransferase
MATKITLHYIASQHQIGIRQWGRSDRRLMQRWPDADLPAHWYGTGQPEPGQRESFAVDLDSQLVGRITLADQHIFSIYLRADRLGRGIGQQATWLFCDYAQRLGLAPLYLNVASDNARAITCYQRVGWQRLLEYQASNGYYYQVFAYGSGHAISGRALSGAGPRHTDRDIQPVGGGLGC